MYGGVGGRINFALVLGAVPAIGAVPAQAADLGGDCCSDLDERIAELESSTARKGNRKVSLTVSGNKEWSAGYLLERGVRSNRLNRTSQNAPHGLTNLPGGATQDAAGLDLRHSTWFIQSTTYGRIWVGLTDQATERITEINLANTNNFLKHYGRWNGSMLLRLPDGRLSTNSWGQILPQSGRTGEGVPGEGDRWDRVKWDSPEFHGF